jgi:hypothetical protein
MKNVFCDIVTAETSLSVIGAMIDHSTIDQARKLRHGMMT